MAAVLPVLLEAIEPAAAGLRGDRAEALAALEDAADRMAAAIGHNGAAKCAIDIALHDLVGKRLGLPVATLLGVDGEIPPTDFTLGIDEPAVVAERARRAADFPALKVKVGGPTDVATVRAVRVRVRRARSASTPTPAGRPTRPRTCCRSWSGWASS